MLIRSSYVRKVALGFFSALPLATLALSMTPAAVAQDNLVTALRRKCRLSEINLPGELWRILELY